MKATGSVYNSTGSSRCFKYSGRSGKTICVASGVVSPD